MIHAFALPTGAVLRKELRVRLRGWRPALVLFLYLTVLAAVAAGFLLQRYSITGGDSEKVGLEFFSALAVFQLLLLTFVTPLSTAGAVSGERQRHTWDILRVTALSPLEILGGKLLAALAYSLLLVVSSVPLLALVFLFGGIGPRAMVPAMVVLLASVLLFSALGLFVSTLTSRLVVAYTVSVFLCLLLTVGISLLAIYLQAGGPASITTLSGVLFGSEGTGAPLTPLAQLDPLVAVLSALPSDQGGTILGDLGEIQHAFGLHWQFSLWGAFTIESLSLSAVLVGLATYLAIRPPPWVRSGGAR